MSPCTIGSLKRDDQEPMKAAATARRVPARRAKPEISLNETAYLRLKEALVTLAYKPANTSTPRR